MRAIMAQARGAGQVGCREAVEAEGEMEWLSILVLVSWANGAPVMARLVFGRRGCRALDGGARWRDGRALLGPSKTWRGVGTALASTPVVAWTLGVSPLLGLGVAAAAMTGDLATSFLKRRLGDRSSAARPGLDQFAEALLPALLAVAVLGGGWTTVAAVVAGFTLIDLALTPLIARLWRRWRR
ncbi:CDP-archaeol synthase [Marichromatium sp. PS1]